MDTVAIESVCEICDERIPIGWFVRKRFWFIYRDVLRFDWADVVAHEWSHQ